MYLLSILGGFGVSSLPKEKVVDVESLTVAGVCANKTEVVFKNRTAKTSLLKYGL